MILIRSKPHSLYYQRPIAIWAVFNFISFFTTRPDTVLYVEIFFGSTTIILAIWYFLYLRKPELIVNESMIIYQTKIAGQREEYPLIDIDNFTWGEGTTNLSFDHGINELSDDFFQIHFKNSEPITVIEDEYENFSELRRFFFKYCTDNGIIEIRPLEERKRRRFRKFKAWKG